ncbi:OFA family MFS transporter [Spirochaetota bacterium]
MSKLSENKWTRAAIPALLIHCSIGTVYCWSLLKTDIALFTGYSKASVEWAFSLAIFMLGMSAAFGGKIIEKDIHKSSLISALFFAIGFIGTGFFVYIKSLPGIFLSYGIIMGIGLGFGYLAPVKTLMLWFSKQKGLATGIAVAGFGLAKVIASPIMNYLLKTQGIVRLFYILGVVYFISMFLGHLLLKKPEGWVESAVQQKGKIVKIIFKNPLFWGIWTIFFINITCGLALISQEKDILAVMSVPAVTIALVSSLSAAFNAFGRLGFASLGDKLKDRNSIYKIIFVLSALFSIAAFASNSITAKLVFLVVSLFCVINAGYGGGFSNLPTLLSDRFGMEAISQIHGLTLTAWAIAGIAGNQLSSFILTVSGSFSMVLLVIAILYILALIIAMFLPKQKSTI